MRYSSAFFAGAIVLGLATLAPAKASAGHYYNYGCCPYASYYGGRSYYGRPYGYGRPYCGTYWGQGRRVARRVNRRRSQWY